VQVVSISHEICFCYFSDMFIVDFMLLLTAPSFSVFVAVIWSVVMTKGFGTEFRNWRHIGGNYQAQSMVTCVVELKLWN
jgi:hypothetical protein